ncbi:MAG: TPM domain-containing protein [Chitinophagaceae bacterium]|nr:MAG: TPM domain-containing protein [Chitinophagaceae bacterium]
MDLPFIKKKKHFFTVDQEKRIVEAVRDAERRTSGEVRVFVESHCKFMDPIDRATEIFFNLKMEKTDDRNAVLVYIAIKDRQLALFGDEGIHRKVGTAFWAKEVELMIAKFNGDDYAEGISSCIRDIGDSLHEHFPYDKDTDKNELPDDIVFGK